MASYCGFCHIRLGSKEVYTLVDGVIHHIHCIQKENDGVREAEFTRPHRNMPHVWQTDYTALQSGALPRKFSKKANIR